MPEKKRYFKKEKKEIRLKRHKAKSASQLKAAEKKNLRRGQDIQPNPLTHEARSGNKIHFPKPQFPNISRFITESFEKITLGSYLGLARVWIANFSRKPIRHAKRKNFWMSILLVGSLFFALFLSWKLWIIYTTWQKAKEDYTRLEHQLATWEDITKQYPTYRDAYFEAAVLAYRLGEKIKEQQYLQKTLAIDPNFQPARELQKISK